MKWNFAVKALLCLVTSCIGIARAGDTSWEDLKDDVSRQTLFIDEVIPAKLAEEKDNPSAPKDFALPKEFVFPDDAKFDKVEKKARGDVIFGIDVSHWTGNIKFHNLALQEVDFVYVKATQGTKFKDGMFGKYWADLGKLDGDKKVYRGAYHFLTANDDVVEQANRFVEFLALHGGIGAGDMPPCLDLEWDRTSTNPDRWAGQDAAKIIEKARTWLEIVEQKTKRTPIIYTARSWWKSRKIDEKLLTKLDRYHIWIADYSTSHKAVEKPAIINGKTQKLWQFADDANVTTGYKSGLDANIYYGTRASFEQDFGITQ
ncbi:GH25 family lysozyme [Sinorhizobium terangae]|uniref:GH25 family lysozyme n=1 Tax=Sinorhizobium terangae TaxID=110322 RepID=UPI0024B14F49|nr:GH25 family lysozyme [Sinorhizobium terangae]WFU50708.1 GH25 family lysozyme [Sinorhizobium terangae]